MSSSVTQETLAQRTNKSIILTFGWASSQGVVYLSYWHFFSWPHVERFQFSPSPRIERAAADQLLVLGG